MAITLPFLRAGFSLPFWPGLAKPDEPGFDGIRMQRHEPTLDIAPDLDIASDLDIALDIAPALDPVIEARQPTREAVLAMLNQAAQAIENLQDHCATVTASSEEAERARIREMAEIDMAVEGLRQETAERSSHVRDLETRQAAADQVVVDLRARLACVERKLASSLETARYQAMTQELADQAPLDLARMGSPLVQTAAA